MVFDQRLAARLCRLLKYMKRFMQLKNVYMTLENDSLLLKQSAQEKVCQRMAPD